MATKSNPDTLYYGMLHYHCRPGGVRTVMENAATSLYGHGKYKKIHMFFIGDILSHKKYVGTFEIPKHSVVNIDIDELNYSSKKYKTKKSFLKDAEKIRDRVISALALEECSDENPYFLHVHNMNLGKSPLVSCAINLLAEWALKKPLLMIYQIHDLAENGRYGLLSGLQNCTGKFDNEFAASIMYPNFRSVVYATINPEDRKNMIEIGIEDKRVCLLPNAIDVSEFKQKSLDKMSKKELASLGLDKNNFGDELKKRIADFAKKNGFKFDKKKEIILAPLKCMRRKNIMESILITQLLGKNYQLLISLDAASGDDKKYSSKVKKFVKKNKLPVVIGMGHEIISPVPDRVIEDGKIVYFNMDDMFEISHAVLTTSLVEGFGFVFHEGWLTDKYVFGRKIPFVTDAYEKNKMDFSHMYIKLNIDPSWINLERIKKKYFDKVNSLRKKAKRKPMSKKEFEIEFREKKLKGGFIDFGDLDIVAQEIFMQELPKYKKKLLEINPQLNPVLRVKKNMINKNKEMSEKNYSLKANAKRLKKLFEKGKELKKEKIINPKVDNEKIIEKYLDLENIRLLI